MTHYNLDAGFELKTYATPPSTPALQRPRRLPQCRSGGHPCVAAALRPIPKRQTATPVRGGEEGCATGQRLTRSSRHENASWRVRPGPGLRSGDPGQGPSLGERRRVGRFWRWVSSPGFSFGRPCDLPGLSGRARIGLCRCPAGSPPALSTTVVEVS